MGRAEAKHHHRLDEEGVGVMGYRWGCLGRIRPSCRGQQSHGHDGVGGVTALEEAKHCHAGEGGGVMGRGAVVVEGKRVGCCSTIISRC